MRSILKVGKCEKENYMKKVLLTIFLIMFTSLSANATYSVHFGNTGRPAFAVHGGMVRRSINTFGSNAAFLPSNRALAGQRQRAIARERAITRALSSMGNPYAGRCNRTYSYNANAVAVEPSRFSRDYTPRTQKSYTRDGITYYN